MLDDLFKNTIVLIEGRYVKTPSDLPAATAAKALWAALKKDWWCATNMTSKKDGSL